VRQVSITAGTLWICFIGRCITYEDLELEKSITGKSCRLRAGLYLFHVFFFLS